ncbi:MAG: DNA repair protein RecO [Patescibacteria group bacterium]
MIVSAIVLNVRDHRENDRIITCYTRQLGKIEILVRSAKKITSKLAPFSSGLYSLINLVIEPGKNYYHLIGGEIKKYFNNINNDYEKNIRVGQILNIFNKITKPAKPDDRLFDLTVKTLEKIDTLPKIKVEIFIYAFLIKFLSLLGYKPEIKKCLICQKIPSAKVNFDINRGGIICLKCSTSVDKSEINIQMTDKVLNLLQNLLYKNFDFLEKLNFKSTDFIIVKNVIDKFLEWHLK